MVLSLKISKSMQKIKIIVMLSMVFLGSRCFGQTTKTIDCLEDSYQACLDKGVNMLGCSKVFYQQMDSMLNSVYKKLRGQMSSSQSSKLKAEQIKWLAKRDQYFKNIKLAPEEEALEEEDREMVIIDKKSSFVKERVIELLKKL